MTTNTPPARERATLGTIVTNIFIFGFALFMLWLLLPFAIERFSAGPLALPQALPTAAVRAQPTPAQRAQEGPSAPFSAPVAMPAAPIDGIAQNEATATALFDAAVQAGEAQSIPDPAPAILVTKPSVREGAGANVPTAEPVLEVTDWFGSKQAPVNIQATKQCKHGQVWIDGKGCKNP
jgi:hypothetical protein